MKRANNSLPQKARLTWSTINDFFAGEWVELVDYKWDWNQPTPTLGRVRHHSKDRQELLTQIKSASHVSDSIVLYIGETRSNFELSLSAAV